MSDYIKREDAIRIARLQGKHAQFDGMAQDVAPVRHGRWIKEWGNYECSLRGGLDDFADNYCPYCGAKMDR